MVILGLVLLIVRKILQFQNFQNKSKISSDLSKVSLWNRLYSARNGDFRSCNYITYLKKRNIHIGIVLPGYGKNCHTQRGFNRSGMVILGLVMLIERKILQWQNFQNKSKVTSDIAKRLLCKRLYSTRNGDFMPCNSISYLKKRNFHMGIVLLG